MSVGWSMSCLDSVRVRRLKTDDTHVSCWRMHSLSCVSSFFFSSFPIFIMDSSVVLTGFDLLVLNLWYLDEIESRS